MGEFAQTNYNNAITRDNLLSSLYPRLMLAKDLLRDDGVIFCSIDDKNQAYIKCLFDEIFGESNFISNIIWEKSYSPINLKKHFSNSHDFILCYSKNIFDATCNGLKRDEEANSRYSNPDKDPRGDWKSACLYVGPKVEENVYPVVSPSGKTFYPSSGYSWLFSKERFKEMVDDNRIYFGPNGDNTPSLKRFLSEVKQTITPMTIWKYKEVGHSQNATQKLKSIFNNEALFEYPKPVELLKRCFELYSDENSIILDFYAGSGTTGQAVLELNKSDGGNRQFILCTNNEKTEMNPNGIAYDVTSKRLKRIMSGECYDGTKPSEWLKNNEPYGDNLEVLEIKNAPSVFNKEKNPFELIDETLYGKEKFTTLSQKIKWVCENFENTQKYLEYGDE